MAKRCTRCGNFLMDDERFCTRCGENVSNVPPEAGLTAGDAGPDNSFGRNNGYTSPYAQQANTQGGASGGAPYGAPNGAPNGAAYPPPYAPAPAYRPAQDEMSLGKWVGTIVVTTFFGLISLIFLFVWGFGDGPECRRRYCKAMLIADLIGLGVGILFMIIFFVIIGNAFNSALSEYLQRMRDLGYDMSQFTTAALSAFVA